MVRALLILVLLGIPTRLLAQDSRLLVSVIDYAGAPIPNARITVVLNHPEPARRVVVARGETDALGTTAISVEPRRPYVVLVSHDYFALPEPRAEPWIVPAVGDVVLGFKLALIADLQRDAAVGPGPPAEPRGVVAGQVVAPDGAPLANIKVTAYRNGSHWGETRTRKDGSYRLSLVPGGYQVAAGGYDGVPVSVLPVPTYTSYERSKDVTAVVAAHGGTRVDFVLTPLRLFNVTVTAIDELGDIVPNADVSAVGLRQDISMGASRKTGADGTTMIGPTVPARIQLDIHGTRGDQHLAASRTIEVRDAPLQVTVQLAPAGSITGRVEFLDRLEPLHEGAGLHVVHTASGMRPGMWSSGDPSGRVAANGEFVATGIAGERCLHLVGIPGGWRLLDITYNGEDYTYRPFSLEPGENRAGVVIRVEPKPVDLSVSRRCPSDAVPAR